MGRLVGKRILITGSNRGLGLEIVKQLLRNFNPEKVLASCRNPEQATELKELAENDPGRVHMLQIWYEYISDTLSFSKAVKEVKKVKKGKGIHVLINNAGIFLESSQALEELKMETMLEFYRVNTLGTVFLTQAFLPLLAIANATEKGRRCAATKSMSIDLKDKNILVVAMNPGWVKTDQGGSSAELEVDVSVSGILKVLDELTEKHSGKLVQYDGQILEWSMEVVI